MHMLFRGEQPIYQQHFTDECADESLASSSLKSIEQKYFMNIFKELIDHNNQRHAKNMAMFAAC